MEEKEPRPSDAVYKEEAVDVLLFVLVTTFSYKCFPLILTVNP